jgi:hypothetical protein
MEEFAPCTNVVAQASSAEDIIAHVFDDEISLGFFILSLCKTLPQ